jgi:plasmid stabilization system protein ParE
VKVRYRERALSDIDGIFEFINVRSPAGARNVLHALADAIDEIGAHPLASPVSSDADIRVKILTRYRYKIFYSIVGDDVVEIVHVRHAARRPWV